MTQILTAINPFYAARLSPRPFPPHPVATTEVRYAKLPKAPRNGSPNPRLTSLYHWEDGTEYGSRAYPGNCAGGIIKDLLLYYRPQNVLDPMKGSGTCADVCRELGIRCVSFDLKQGHDACDPALYPLSDVFDFIWIHPPYWRQKVYSTDSRDLSACKTLKDFLARYQALLDNCARVLKPGGKLAILMGNYTDKAAGYVPLVFYTQLLSFRAGLVQRDTDIIRFSHGASSSRKTYRSAFIPGLHDTCVIVEKRG